MPIGHYVSNCKETMSTVISSKNFENCRNPLDGGCPVFIKIPETLLSRRMQKVFAPPTNTVRAISPIFLQIIGERTADKYAGKRLFTIRQLRTTLTLLIPVGLCILIRW